MSAVSNEPSDGRAVDSLKPIAKVTGHGPAPELFELAEWASIRWAARRIRPFLVTASPGRAVVGLPTDRRTGMSPAPVSPATRELLASGGGVLRLPPRVDVMPTLLAAVAFGPTLVVAPERDLVALFAARLRRAGLSVAVVPDDWAMAAGGVDVVIGTRSAAWAPCPDLAAVVLLDEHDEAHQNERTPTWHARDVVVERCRRAGVPFVLVSPAPTLTAVVDYAGARGVVHPQPARRARRLAAGHRGRPHRGGPVEAVPGHLGADRADPRPGVDRGLREQHHGSRKGARLSIVPGAASDARRVTPRSGSTTTGGSRVDAVASCARQCASRAAPGGSRTSVPGSPGCARSSRPRRRVPSSRSLAPIHVRRSGQGSTWARRRCCTGSARSMSWHSSSSTPRCWPRASGPASRRLH